MANPMIEILFFFIWKHYFLAWNEEIRYCDLICIGDMVFSKAMQLNYLIFSPEYLWIEWFLNLNK